MNPLFNAMNNMTNNIPNQQMNDLRSMYQLFKSKGNPMVLFNQIAQRNPKMNPILGMLNQGQNPQQIFYNLCKQQGVDPQSILNQITGNNN